MTGPDPRSPKAEAARLEQFVHDVVDRIHEDLQNSVRGTPAHAYRYFEYAETLRGLIVGIEHGLFPPNSIERIEDLALPLLEAPEKDHTNEVAGLLGVGEEMYYGVSAGAEVSAEARQRSGTIAVEHMARVQSLLYCTFVHSHDEVGRDLMALSLFGSAGEWSRMMEHVRNAARQPPGMRLRALASLPTWIVDGLDRWRASLRFVADAVFDLPLDGLEPEAVRQVIESHFSGGDVRASQALRELFERSRYARSSVVLELAFACLSRDSFVDLQPMAEDEIVEELERAWPGEKIFMWPQPRFLPSGDPVADLVDGFVWRLLPPRGTQARVRLDDLAEALAPAVTGEDQPSPGGVPPLGGDVVLGWSELDS